MLRILWIRNAGRIWLVGPYSWRSTFMVAVLYMGSSVFLGFLCLSMWQSLLPGLDFFTGWCLSSYISYLVAVSQRQDGDTARLDKSHPLNWHESVSQTLLIKADRVQPDGWGEKWHPPQCVMVCDKITLNESMWDGAWFCHHLPEL